MCLIKILIWLVKESSTLGVMSSYLLIKILWISTSHLLYLILSIVFLYLPWMVFLFHHLFVNLFLSENLSFREFIKVLNSGRNVSAPGVNMIPYKVYNLCPNICDYLFCLLNLVFKIVLYLFIEELVLRFIFPNQAITTQRTSRNLG